MGIVTPRAIRNDPARVKPALRRFHLRVALRANLVHRLHEQSRGQTAVRRMTVETRAVPHRRMTHLRRKVSRVTRLTLFQDIGTHLSFVFRVVTLRAPAVQDRRVVTNPLRSARRSDGRRRGGAVGRKTPPGRSNRRFRGRRSRTKRKPQHRRQVSPQPKQHRNGNSSPPPPLGPTLVAPARSHPNPILEGAPPCSPSCGYGDTSPAIRRSPK